MVGVTETITKRKDVEDYRKDRLLNVVPYKKNEKRPDLDSWTEYQEKLYIDNIPEGQNIGTICGKISQNLMVLDPDDKELFKEVKEWVFKNIGETFTVESGMKGGHLYFRTFHEQKSLQLDNDKNQHLDILAEKKAVTLPPSIHVETGKLYEIICDAKIKQLTVEEFEKLFTYLKSKGFKPNKECKKEIKLVNSDLKIPSSVNYELSKLGKGANRQGSILEHGTRIMMKAILHFQEVTEADAVDLSKKLNSICKEPYEEIRAIQLGKEIYRYGHANLDGVEIKLSTSAFDIAAEILLQNYTFITLRETGEIYYYDEHEGIYKQYAETLIKTELRKIIHKCRIATDREVIETIKAKTWIDSKELFEAIHIISDNVILDSRTFKTKSHSPDILTTKKLPFKIDPEAKNTKLWEHIMSIIDPNDVNVFLELIWMLISGRNPHKKMFVFLGVPHTQKTAFIHILKKIFSEDNFSAEDPQSYLNKNIRFGASAFFEKRANIAEEIDGWTKEMIEKQKQFVGGAPINMEWKGKNKRGLFYPERFVFMFATNGVGDVYSKIENEGIITRYQFMLFRNKIENRNEYWYDDLFTSKEDEQNAISFLINVVIAYKKKNIRTKFANDDETKSILKSEMPLEDRFFDDERIIRKEGGRLEVNEAREAFVKFTGLKINNNQMGNILKKRGIRSTQTGNKTIYKGWILKTEDNMTLEASI